MSYVIAAISNSGGAPEQAYRKMQSAGACPERPHAGACVWMCVRALDLLCVVVSWFVCACVCSFSVFFHVCFLVVVVTP